MGMAAACAYDLMRRPPWQTLGPWFYLPGLAAGAALIAYPHVLPGPIDLNSALRPLNALLLIGFALGGGLAAGLLGSRVAVYLGKLSYAMYILHVPLLWWYSRWVRGLPGSFGLPGGFYIALVIAVSALVYRFIEEPANRFLRARLSFP
jgi:peptidoglycan/LPS O-acetylase OafA/YrhL